MNLFSSSSICGNCGKHMYLIAVIDDYKNLVRGKKFLNVDKFLLK